MSKRKVLIIALVAVLILGLLSAWYFLYEKPRKDGANDGNSISVTVKVTHENGEEKEFLIKTQAKTLSEALQQEGLIEAHEDQYGLFVDTVDGEAAAMEDSKAWVFDKNGEMCETGISDTLIADADVYAFYIISW